MMTLTRSIAALILAAQPVLAQAKPDLKDVVEIQEKLITIGMAYEIQQKCDSISARLFRGTRALLGVERRARELGYSAAEIDAYQDDKVEKERLIVIARGRLADLGVVDTDSSTYCTVGEAQISAGTPIGYLIY